MPSYLFRRKIFYSRDSSCVPWTVQTSTSLHMPVHLCNDIMMCSIIADNLFSRTNCLQMLIYEAVCHCMSSVPIVSDSMGWPNSLQWVHHMHSRWVISPSDRPLSAPILPGLCKPSPRVHASTELHTDGPCWKLVWWVGVCSGIVSTGHKPKAGWVDFRPLTW